jgi:hypothetical protein
VPPIRSALVCVAWVTCAAAPADAQRYPACGTWEGSLTLADSAADFYAAAAQDAETAAALWYQTAAETALSEARAALFREAARASERAIADLAEAARLLEGSGQLRLARGVRSLKARHRARADADWERLEQLGEERDPDPDRRTLACDDLDELTLAAGADALRQRAELLLIEADDLLARVVEVAEQAAQPADERRLTIQALDTQVRTRLLAGADALLAAGCQPGGDGLDDLLEASYCYDATRPLIDAQWQGAGEIQMRRATILRAIARHLANETGDARPLP